MAGAGKFTFHINWKITAFSLLLLPVLLSLGFWQLDRAQEKQTLQESWQQRQALPAVPYNDKAIQDNRRVYVQGEFNKQNYWLVENKLLDGQLGYHVVMPFKLLQATTEAEVVLVNRGWVAAGHYRQDNPNIETPMGVQRLTGTLKTPSDSRFIEENQNAVLEWPYRLLEIDKNLIEKQLGSPVADRIILLDADSAGALAVNWQAINMRAEKHQGYAVQWFGLALALITLWLFSNSNLKSVLRKSA